MPTFTPDFSFEFTPDQAYDMFRLQAEANDMMSTDWRTSSNDEIAYYRAAVVEAFEAMTAYGYKWWKKETPNMDHVEMELIDILHFDMSDALRQMYIDLAGDYSDLEARMRVAANDYFNVDRVSVFVPGRADASFDELPFQSFLDEYAKSLLSYQCGSFSHLALLFNKMGMSANLVYGMYMGKNGLNKFRAANGQKEGRYNRQWYPDRDDNDCLMAYLNQCDSSGVPITEGGIMEFLTKAYN